MNRIITPVLAILFLIAHQQAFTQEADPAALRKKTPLGVSWQSWETMNARWQSYSTRVYILKNDGSELEGQLTWMNDSLLMVQKNFDLPNGLFNPDDYAMVSVRDIATLKIRLAGHPYQGLIIGMLAGAVPGVVTGLILAQGWTVIPAIVFGAITAGGGGTAGSFIQKAKRKQEIDIPGGELSMKFTRKLKRSALFSDELPDIPDENRPAELPDFENLVKKSHSLRLAFPDNPFAISVSSSLMTNSVRKRLQNWYMSPIFGPPEKYYETRIGLQADVSHRIGNRFQAGAHLQLFPGDISSTFFNSYSNDLGVYYNYNHHFNQTTFGLYGGWLLHPPDRWWATRLEVSIQAGPVISDVYEHFYFQWNATDGIPAGETFIRKHNFQPGGMMRLKTSWYLIPGFSIDSGIEGFWIKRITFSERVVLPQTNAGPLYIPGHRLNFSNVQGYLGISIHL